MSPAPDAPPASRPRPRNRLRKLIKLRPCPPAADAAAQGNSNSNSNVSPRASSDSGRPHGSVPPSPDLSSQKWLEYIRKSGYLCPMESSPHLQHTHTRSRSLTHHPNRNILPELAHLAIDIPEKSPRRSLDTHRATASPRSASSSLRRYAKTPVRRVGQLEAADATPPGAESIAEQYRALLRSRSHDSLRYGHAPEGPGPGPSPSPSPGLGLGLEPRGSPTSDGTLVAFEEDTIFFKPVSFWPEPLASIREGGGGGGGGGGSEDDSRALPRPGVVSLQIATNLLARELSCAVSNEVLRAPTDLRQLQTWVMIEAYEALRDQVLQMALPADESEALGATFDLWLRALYRVHDDFAREASGPSDSDVEAMQAEDLG